MREKEISISILEGIVEAGKEKRKGKAEDG